MEGLNTLILTLKRNIDFGQAEI